jgi:myosin-1
LILLILLQAIYNRLFSWIVSLINQAVEVTKDFAGKGRSTVIGVLDIYGFEIFNDNRFVRVEPFLAQYPCTSLRNFSLPALSSDT